MPRVPLDADTVTVITGATISKSGTYRYRLWRRWKRVGNMCVWVMLNPSTGDATEDDATIRRCIGFAKQWGYSGIEVVNIYGLRSKDPKAMLKNPRRVSPTNFFSLHSQVRFNKNALCAWGNNAEPRVALEFLDWAEKEIGWKNVMCLGVTKKGQPGHPVRLPYATLRVPVALAQGRRP